ncbi:unnamed protein product [Rotaria magnacalcarata]|uniref:Uncharacterized protein n=1 Tax=Rotaria magnacalcarata TaxID=392030 RepID=A0A816VM12_9BILA|nr:unnamed protein product [Rotaria magnacalcarata]
MRKCKNANKKSQYDKNTTHRQFEVGQFVCVTVPVGHSLLGKMRAPFQRPCKIMETISSSLAFIVKRLSGNVNLGTVNADSMKIAKIIHSNNQDSLISTAVRASTYNLVILLKDDQ